MKRHKENQGRSGKATNVRFAGRRDFIAERAAYMQYRNAVLTPYLPTLGIASHYRQEAVARKLSGRKLLG